MTLRKTALITGATRGLGRALALEFARGGYRVYGTARGREGLDALAYEAEREGLEIIALEGNVATTEDNARVARRLAADAVRLDVLVHNAGILGPRVPLAEYPPDVFSSVMAVNVFGPFDLTRQLLPLLAPNAVIQFVTSGAGTGARERWGAYNVSKIALEGLAGIWARELAERDVKVFLIDPGRMRTDMRARAYPDEDPATVEPPETIAPGFVHVAESAAGRRSGERVELSALPRR